MSDRSVITRWRQRTLWGTVPTVENGSRGGVEKVALRQSASRTHLGGCTECEFIAVISSALLYSHMFDAVWFWILARLRTAQAYIHNVIWHVLYSRACFAFVMKHSGEWTSILGTIAKLQQATVSVFMSVCPPVLPRVTTRLPLDGFSWNLIFECFSKICTENSNFIEIWRAYRYILNDWFSLQLSSEIQGYS
jgi:hypothetical protein